MKSDSLFYYQHWGRSEFKRKDYKESYYNMVFSLNELIQENKVDFNQDDIKEKFIKYDVYKENKKDNNVSREIALAKNLKFIKNDKTLQIDFVGKLILDSKGKVGPLTTYEVFMLCYLLSTGINDESLLVTSIKKAQLGNMKLDDFLFEIGIPNYSDALNELKELILNNEYWKIYEKLIVFGSGNPNKKQLDIERNKITKKYLNLWLELIKRKMKLFNYMMN